MIQVELIYRQQSSAAYYEIIAGSSLERILSCLPDRVQDSLRYHIVAQINEDFISMYETTQIAEDPLVWVNIIRSRQIPVETYERLKTMFEAGEIDPSNKPKRILELNQ